MKNIGAVILLCISFPGFSQTIIKGKIIDKTTREAIEYAIISFGQKSKTANSDKQGNFELTLPKGSNTIYISIVGYQAQTIDVQTMPHPFIIKLERGAIDLAEVKITPQSGNSSFHTISGIDLNLHPARSSQDLLRMVPGLFIAQHMGGGKAEQIFLRGFDADHGSDVQINVDGIPVNMVSHVHGQGYADLHFLLPELIKNYDFGKGVYYTANGDLCTAGYISFNTIDVLEKNMIKVDAGQFNTGRVMAMVNILGKKASDNGQNFYVAGEAAYTDGPFNLPEHFSHANVYGKYTAELNTNNKLTAIASYYTSDWKASGEIPLRLVNAGLLNWFGVVDSTQSGYTSRANASVKLNTTLSNRLQMENQAYYSHYFFNLHVDNSFYAENPLNGDEEMQRELRDMFGYEARLTDRRYFNNDDKLVSSIGIGTRVDKIYNSSLGSIKNGNVFLGAIQDGNINETNGNAYIDESFTAGKWLINAGSRIDYFNFQYIDLLNPSVPARHATIVCPKLNIQYTTSNNLQFYIKSGKGFHSNDARVVVFNQGNEILPAAYGTDIGAIWKPLPNLLISTAAWYLYLQQEFVYNQDDGTLEPGDATKRMGIDLSARYQFNKNIFADLNINLAKPRFADSSAGNNYLPLAPTFTSTGGLYYKNATGFNGGISYRYMHGRPATNDYSLVAQGYFVTDININYTKKKYEIGLIIENLFNVKWKEFQEELVTKLKDEPQPVDGISFTPGTPFFARIKCSMFF